MNKVATLFHKLFLTHINKSQEMNTIEQLRGGEVGNLLPFFRVRDQLGRKIISDKIPYAVTKLIFLSDTCGLCFEVLQMLASTPNSKKYLVFKGNEGTYSNTIHKEFHYKFSIIRSSKIVDSFGIKRVPTVLTLNLIGIIERVDEVSDIEDLFSYLED